MNIDAARPPAVPTREQQSISVAEETACAIPEKPRPWWLQMVALNKDRFSDAALFMGLAPRRGRLLHHVFDLDPICSDVIAPAAA